MTHTNQTFTDLHCAIGIDDLCARMNRRSEEERLALANRTPFQPADFSHLPNFGGARPRDTRRVWSWDPTHLIVPDEDAGRFRVVPRDDNKLGHVSRLRR